VCVSISAGAHVYACLGVKNTPTKKKQSNGHPFTNPEILRTMHSGATFRGLEERLSEDELE